MFAHHARVLLFHVVWFFSIKDRMNIYIVLLFCFVFSFLSCGSKTSMEKKEMKQTPGETISIEIKTNDINRETGAHGVISCTSYISLSDEILLNKIRRVLISDDCIYILDSSPKIVCFNKNGEAIYSIDQRGAGPKEFANIIDFSIDKKNKQLVTYDSGKRRLSFYNMITGVYLYDKPITYISPNRICITPEGFFFHTPDHFNYPKQKEKHFFLFYSSDGADIDASYLPHDAISEYYFGMGDGHPFFHNEPHPLYNKPFDSKVYILENGGITPFLDISLPNFLPMEKIAGKIDPVVLSRSDYSFGLTDFYIANNVLHFSFSKEGYIQTAFFDLANDRLLYCGTRVSDVPTRNLPLYSIISGTSGKHFFSIVYPEQILQRMESHPDLIPRQLKNVLEDDNPVLVFYEIIEKGGGGR
ncbi:hypothetical protein M2480_002794 [Parabacteroides sp. PFB2-12]|nr:hypothetical protein [Parabacteroides sp. PM6-13]MDH6391792.1 hypothetical protein [Parabacteroides sp. PFB2-12]